jgi:4-amino-4-deoxy-L-arabinose transferase-like glycosyltransferase
MTQLVATKPKPSVFRLAFDGTATPVKTSLFLLVCACWLVPGLIGHDPWKPDEAHTFGVVYSMLKSGDWIVPSLAGEHYLDKPPLYYWTAALSAKLFAPVLAQHDGARLASGFYMGLVVLFTALSGGVLLGKRFGRLSALLLLGSLGLFISAHAMVVDVALLAGCSMVLYGFALCLRQPVWAGLSIGTGIGIGFLAKGTIALALGLVPLALLPMVSEIWRNRAFGRCLAVTLAAALPWILLWPIALYVRSPQLAMEWLWLNDWADFTSMLSAHSLVRFGHYLSILPWYAWPALPLALVTLWYGRHSAFARPEIKLLTLMSLSQLLVLSLVGEARELHAMPLLLPLSLLAASGIDGLRRGAASALDWFGMMTFGLFAVLLWMGWITLLTGLPVQVADYLQERVPGYHPQFNGFAFGLALTLTLMWLIAITRLLQSNRRAIVNWTAGITMVWMLAMSLWLPYIDEGKTYRGMIASLQQVLPQHECVASRGLGEPQRAMLDYFGNLRTQRLERMATNPCGLLLTQGTIANEEPAASDWHKIWEGARPGDKVERYRLYQRTGRN